MPKGSPERTAARQEEIKTSHLKKSETRHLFQDRLYITTTTQKRRYSWLFSKESIFAGMKNYSLFFWIMKSFQKNKSLRNWRHPLQTGSSS